MIALNGAHREYDFAMEVLCMLPNQPCWALLADLCHDLGVAKQSAVNEALDELRDRHGLTIRTTNLGHKKGRGVMIEKSSQVEAQKLGQAYFDRVYAVFGGVE